MRNYFIIFTLLSVIACSRSEKATIRGKITNSEREMTYLEELRTSAGKIIDSSRIGWNGRFAFHFKNKKPAFYTLKTEDGKALSFIVSPGERIFITADYNDFYNTKTISGSENSIRLNRLHDSLRVAITKLNNLSDEYNRLAKKEGNENTLDSLNKEYVDIINKHRKYSTKYIFEDLTSLANIGALYQQFTPDVFVFNRKLDLQFFKLISDSLYKYYPEVSYVKLLKENFNVMFGNMQKERIMQLAKPIESKTPELILPDRNGKMLSLSSLKGKTVLLSFWSVKQTESINDIQELKKIYKKYKADGFEIFQVCIEKSITDWKRSLFFEEINWPSVCDTTYPNSKILMLYNVNSLPMNYLLSPDQSEIIGKNLTPQMLDNKLSSILTRN